MSRPDSAAGDSRVHDVARHRRQPGHDVGSDEHDAFAARAPAGVGERIEWPQRCRSGVDIPVGQQENRRIYHDFDPADQREAHGIAITRCGSSRGCGAGKDGSEMLDSDHAPRYGGPFCPNIRLRAW
jgi:hypothetical protein